MQAVIQKWGNSLAIRIPRSIVQKFQFHSGSRLDIEADDGHISLRPRKYCLKEMLARINNENSHELLLEDGSPKGREVW